MTVKRMVLTDVDNKAKHARALVVAEPKVGKTTYLVASCLGLLPNQKRSLVTTPKHLHVLAIDSSAVEGIDHFLTNLCGVEDANGALDVDVWNFSSSVEAAMNGTQARNTAFYVELLDSIEKLKQEILKTGGVHAVIVSSLTGLAEVFKRSISGPPIQRKDDGSIAKVSGSAMDVDKWQMLGSWLVDVRVKLQVDTHHTFWEGHVYKKPKKIDEPQDAPQKESLFIEGKVGENWGFNVDQVFRLMRESVKHPNTKIDRVYLNTQPKLDFIANGRAFGSRLSPREDDLVDALEKLGKEVAPE